MAKTGKFKCAKCDRTFSMAAHLGRHQSTVHAAKKPPARLVVAVKRRRFRRATARPHQFLPVGPAEVTAQLDAYREQLAAQRAEIDSQLAVLDHALAALGATARPPTKHVAGGRRGGRAAWAGSLKSFILRVLQGRVRPLAVKDIAAAVLNAGYQSRDKDLGRAVHKYLTSMPQIVRVTRGQYRLRG